MKPYREPESFEPALWGAEVDGKFVLLLVCAKSQRATDGKEKPGGGIVCEAVVHPVAIQLGAPACIHYGFRITENEWHVRPIEESGIPRQYAQRALSEAWRGVEEITWGSYPERQYNFRFRVNMIRAIADCERDQEVTMFRNTNAWIRWGIWEDQEMSRKGRAKELSAMGIPTNEKKLNKMVENAEL